MACTEEPSGMAFTDPVSSLDNSRRFRVNLHMEFSHIVILVGSPSVSSPTSTCGLKRPHREQPPTSNPPPKHGSIKYNSWILRSGGTVFKEPFIASELYFQRCELERSVSLNRNLMKQSTLEPTNGMEERQKQTHESTDNGVLTKIP